MVSLIASPDQITDENIVFITLTIDSNNTKKYEGLYINLILKKVGSITTIPTYQQRYNGEPLIWEINKYTYKNPGTFQVSAHIFDGQSFATCSFVVVEKCIYARTNVCNNICTNKMNPNARSINFPTFVQPSLNSTKVQAQGIDYLKPNNIEPISKFTQALPDINISKVQKPGRNVGPS